MVKGQLRRRRRPAAPPPAAGGGVRTRAKALALRAAGAAVVLGDDSGFAYLELRSRRLQKKLPVLPRRKGGAPSAGEVEGVGESNAAALVLPAAEDCGTLECSACNEVQKCCDSVTSSSSAEPNHVIKAQRMNGKGIPVLHSVETDALFVEQEKQIQEAFKEKYNFDPVNEKPLPGRYEWVKSNP